MLTSRISAIQQLGEDRLIIVNSTLSRPCDECSFVFFCLQPLRHTNNFSFFDKNLIQVLEFKFGFQVFVSESERRFFNNCESRPSLTLCDLFSKLFFCSLEFHQFGFLMFSFYKTRFLRLRITLLRNLGSVRLFSNQNFSEK